MALGTKNRQKQTADLCKQHLREKYSDKLGLVEEFILEIEGSAQHPDVTHWGQFTERRKGSTRAMNGPQCSMLPPQICDRFTNRLDADGAIYFSI
jgi:hypothetical protein